MQKATALVLVVVMVLGAAVIALSSDHGTIALAIVVIGGGLIAWSMFRDKPDQER
jgi:uncharacterized membrane protein